MQDSELMTAGTIQQKCAQTEGLGRGLRFQDNSQVFHCNLSTDHTMNDLGRESLEEAQGVGYQEEN